MTEFTLIVAQWTMNILIHSIIIFESEQIETSDKKKQYKGFWVILNVALCL